MVGDLIGSPGSIVNLKLSRLVIFVCLFAFLGASAPAAEPCSHPVVRAWTRVVTFLRRVFNRDADGALMELEADVTYPDSIWYRSFDPQSMPPSWHAVDEQTSANIWRNLASWRLPHLYSLIEKTGELRHLPKIVELARVPFCDRLPEVRRAAHDALNEERLHFSRIIVSSIIRRHQSILV